MWLQRRDSAQIPLHGFHCAVSMRVREVTSWICPKETQATEPWQGTEKELLSAGYLPLHLDDVRAQGLGGAVTQMKARAPVIASIC